MNLYMFRTDELSETCKVSCQNKFVKLVHLVGFITKKFVADRSARYSFCFCNWNFQTMSDWLAL